MTIFKLVSKFHYNLVYNYAIEVIISDYTTIIISKAQLKLNYNFINIHYFQIIRKNENNQVKNYELKKSD